MTNGPLAAVAEAHMAKDSQGWPFANCPRHTLNYVPRALPRITLAVSAHIPPLKCFHLRVHVRGENNQHNSFQKSWGQEFSLLSEGNLLRAFSRVQVWFELQYQRQICTVSAEFCLSAFWIWALPTLFDLWFFFIYNDDAQKYHVGSLGAGNFNTPLCIWEIS